MINRCINVTFNSLIRLIIILIENNLSLPSKMFIKENI